MADLSQYSKNMAYLEEKARNGTLTSDNSIYKELKEKAKNLPELQRWFQKNIDPKVQHV